MNKNNAKDYLPLVQALAQGKYIQFRIKSELDWIDVDEVTDAFSIECYRIKPEPREIWVNRYPNGSESYWFNSKLAAYRCRSNDTAVQVCYREVIE